MALHERLDKVLHAIPPLRAGIEHGLDFGSLREANGGAGGVQGEVFEEVFGELAGVRGEVVFQLVDVAEGFAGGQFACGVNGLSDEVSVGMTGGINAGDFFAALNAAIAVTPRAHDIEVLEREADGIKLGMAGGTGL